MKTRREFGSISIKKYRSGHKYIEASYKTPPDAAKKWPGIRITKRVVKNFPINRRPTAEAWLYEAQKQIQLDAWKPPQMEKDAEDADSTLFEDYAREYVATRHKADGSDLSPGTREKYREYLTGHLLPAFGRMPLRSITEADVRRWLDTYPLGAHGEGLTQRRHSYTLLKSIMGQAARTRLPSGGHLIDSNPCTMTVPRAKSKHVQVIATRKELEQVANAMPPMLQLAVILSGVLGLRRGEVLGLQRRDVDLDTMTLHVRRSAKQQREDSETWHMVLGSTKTANSVRNITIPSSLLPRIRYQLSQIGDKPDSLLFQDSHGNILHAGYLELQWQKARKTVLRLAGMHFHDLRHTALTHLAEHGATVAELEDIAGHADARMAMHYQHAVDSHERAVIENAASAGDSSGDRVERVASVLSSMSESERAQLVRLLMDKSSN